ncbi:MAG: hypothetical protein ACI9GH_000414 [Candidatus Paceibacteria bacterium]|jgi:hypothetical protein
MNDDLKGSIDDLKKSVNRLSERFNSWWKIVWYGMLQGSGAVAGATLIIIGASWFLDILGFVPFVGDRVEDVRRLLNEFRP